jgi:hypothetical protein
MVARLKIVEGRPAGSSVPIGGGRLLIGAAQGCDLRPWDTSVADRHCEVLEWEGRVVIRDLGSDRGTRVNGLRIAPACLARIRPGDRVGVGETVFELESGDGAIGEDRDDSTGKAATGLLQRRLGSGPRAGCLKKAHVSSGMLEGSHVHRIGLPAVQSRAEVALWRQVLAGLAERPDGDRMILDLFEVQALSREAASALLAFLDRSRRRGTAVKLCQVAPFVHRILVEVDDEAASSIFLDAQMAVWSAW